MVIANGGSSGILPGQTDPAYYDAANSTKFPMAFLCDLQLTKDNLGVCRTGWNLSASTNLTNILSNVSAPSTYVIQGVAQTGYFSVDFNLTQLNQTTGKALGCLKRESFLGFVGSVFHILLYFLIFLNHRASTLQSLISRCVSMTYL